MPCCDVDAVAAEWPALCEACVSSVATEPRGVPLPFWLTDTKDEAAEPAHSIILLVTALSG